MGRTIITHVGTSLLSCAAIKHGNVVTDDLLAQVVSRFSSGRPVVTQMERVIKGLTSGLAYYWGPDAHSPHARRDASPSEIASLSILKPMQGVDRVMLFHSDTDSGRFCAEVLKQALQTVHPSNGYPSCAPHLVQLDGLKINDDSVSPRSSGNRDTFVREGLTNYIDAVWKEYRRLAQSPGSHEIIFNVTGGYKGTIPIARDLVLLLSEHASSHCEQVGFDLCYLFQGSDSLISYGSFPVSLDWSTIPVQNLKNGLTEGGVSLAEVEGEPKSYYESSDNGRLRTSALGAMLLELAMRLD